MAEGGHSDRTVGHHTERYLSWPEGHLDLAQGHLDRLTRRAFGSTREVPWPFGCPFGVFLGQKWSMEFEGTLISQKGTWGPLGHSVGALKWGQLGQPEVHIDRTNWYLGRYVDQSERHLGGVTSAWNNGIGGQLEWLQGCRLLKCSSNVTWGQKKYAIILIGQRHSWLKGHFGRAYAQHTRLDMIDLDSLHYSLKVSNNQHCVKVWSFALCGWVNHGPCCE